MNSAQKPSQGDAVIQILQAVPSLAGRRHIDQRQHDPGEYLQDENRQRGAAEDIPPASRLPGHPMRRRVADRPSDLQALIKPVSDLLQP